MATGEHLGRGEQPEKKYTLDQRGGQFDMARGLNVEQSPEVAPLLKEGLGRLLGGKEGTGVRVIGYALPIDRDRTTGKVKEAFLIFPNMTSTNYGILFPKNSTAKEESIRDQENDFYKETMDGIFNVSEQPFTLLNSSPQAGQNNFDAFVLAAGNFANFMRVNEQNAVKKRQKAIVVARYVKTERIGIDDFSLFRTLGNEVVTDLATLRGKWGEYEKEVAQERAAQERKREEEIDGLNELFYSKDENGNQAT